MAITIAIILIGIFLSLSGIHIYWALGGKWGKGAVIPTRNDNTKVIMPGVISTIIVAFGLLGFGFVVFINVFKFGIPFPVWFIVIQNYGLWAITGIFLLRAIGEFQYVGFFKRINDTNFAKNDFWIYSPLCLLIGILALILEINK